MMALVDRESTPAARPFIGRDRELAVADRALAAARAGRGGALLLAGPPGIGKTRMAQQIAEHAEAAGMLPLWGRCPEEPGAPPYWPWTQLLRGCVGDHEGAALAALVGSAAPYLASLDARLAARMPIHEALAPPAEAVQARFQLFDAITGFWQRAAARRPLLLLLDDLHCADVPSLKLLEFVVRECADSMLLVVGTYRDAEVTRSHPLQDTVAMLARQSGTQRLKLGGFSAAETASFVQAVGGRTAPELATALHQRTDGHPLFLTELARLLEDTRACTPADLRRVPEGVHEVIGSRLNRLSPLCSHALGNAAVIGRRFDTSLLFSLLDDTSEDEAAAALDEARRASLVEELPAAAAWQFTHALIRDTLYDEMPAPRRMRLHQRIALTLERRHRDEPNWLSALAHHFHASRSYGVDGKAFEYATRAARQAETARAHEEAVRLYELALQALEAGHDTERCDLLLALGEAQLAAAAHDEATSTFNEAFALARRIPAAQAMARAALGYETASWRTTGIGVVSVGLLREALAANSPLDSVQRARLLAALCRALIYAERVDAAVAIHAQAVAMARRVGDPPALFFALSAIAPARWNPELRSLRLVAGREALALGERLGRPEWTIGHLTGWLVGDLLESGNLDAAADLAARGADMPMLRHNRWVTAVQITCRTMIAMHKGRFAEAEQLAQQGLAIGVSGAAAVQLFTLRREQGRLTELAPVLDRFQQDVSDVATWQPGYIVLCCELGRHEQAAAAFERMAEKDFVVGNVNDGMRPGSLVYMAEACAWLGDAQRAERLYELLTPYAGSGILFGANVASFGSADRVLGMLAVTMGRWEAAEVHFEMALAFDQQSGGRPWLAHSRHEYAAMLLERKRPGDAERALALLDAALASARELGMAVLEQRAQSLRQPAGPAGQAAYPAGLTAREVQVLRMVAEGRTNHDIATTLFRSVNTVANHVRNILAKIDAANRTEAAAFARRHGLLER
ncbi:MAG TPA: AAA family ATPase [Methylibium sp.]|nr:AAA family ATPase [Methylibium sp.]